MSNGPATAGELDPFLDDEVRSLNKILAIARNELDPDEYGDIFDLVSSKLAGLMPAIVAALLPKTPTPKSVTAVQQGVGQGAQLEAIQSDLEQAAGDLSAVAEEITEEPDREPAEVPEPVAYGDETIDKINRSFFRIDLAVEKLQSTKTGKALIRHAAAGAGAVVGAVGLSATHLASTGTAWVIATTASWLYTRIRRVITDLPARNYINPRRPAISP